VRGLISRLERGYAMVWTAAMLPFLLIVVGLTVDGGVMFDGQRNLQNIADAAARAGAMQIDQNVYRQTNGATVALDQNAARDVAAQSVAGEGSDLKGTITADGQRVTVKVERDVPTSFMQIAGIKTVHLTAIAPAEVRFGIERGNKQP